MVWKKNPAEVVALLERAMAPFPCRKKHMFGSPTYFVNDNMFVGLHEGNLIVRLSEADREKLLATWEGAAQFEPMPGRPMREYMVLPESLCGDARALEEWLTRSFEYASSLPPKEPKTRKGKKK